MSSQELLPHTDSERERDIVEQRLALEANKINLMERHSSGMRVILYYLLRQSVCLIYCEDERTHSAAEFPVPNNQALQWYDHAFSHPDANLRHYRQAENGDG